MFVIREIDTNPKKLGIRINNNSISLKNIKVNRVVSPTSGAVVKSSKAIAANNVVYADLNLKKPYPVERYTDYKDLGRFAVYDNEAFVGVGVVE